MAALYSKALFCPLPSLQRSLLVLFKDHGDSLHCLEGRKKKAKSGLLSCVYNKSITIVTTVMSQTLHQGPNSASEGGRAAYPWKSDKIVHKHVCPKQGQCLW